MKSNRLRMLLLGAMLVATSIVLYLFLSSTVDSAPENSTAQEKRVLETRSNQVSETTDQNVASSSDGVDLSQPMALLDRITSAEKVHSQLLRNARAGDVQAMVAVIELARRCGPFWPSRGDQFHPRFEAENSPAESSERAMRRAAAQALSAYCDRRYAPGEKAREIQEFAGRLKAAAEEGSVAAKAAFLFDGEDEVEALSAFAETSDPWVAESALLAISQSKNPLSRQIDSEVFAQSLLSQGEILKVKQMAAKWHACSMGAACGPGLYYQQSACLYEANCSPGLSVQAFIQHRELSTRQYELMKRYLAALKSQFGKG